MIWKNNSLDKCTFKECLHYKLITSQSASEAQVKISFLFHGKIMFLAWDIDFFKFTITPWTFKFVTSWWVLTHGRLNILRMRQKKTKYLENETQKTKYVENETQKTKYLENETKKTKYLENETQKTKYVENEAKKLNISRMKHKKLNILRMKHKKLNILRIKHKKLNILRLKH